MPFFLSLPLEALDLIFEYVAIAYRPSLCGLRLVNKLCCFIATRHQLGRISIKITQGTERIEEDANYWTNRLQTFSAFSAVRHLSIMSSADNDTRVDAEDQDELTYPADPHIFIHPPYDMPNDPWRSIACLLKRLSGLQHVLWGCEAQFPASLLEVLHNVLPHCRLHIRGFNLPSLHYSPDHSQDIDKHELALATSPSLASIVVPVSQYDDSGCMEYNEEAVMQVATGLAPNLVEVHIVDQAPGASLDYFRAVDQGRPRWPGFFPNTPSRRKLDTESRVSLHVCSLSSCSMSRFAAWEKQLNFSILRTLQIWDVDVEVLEVLSRHNFPSLLTLAILLEYPYDPISETYRLDLAMLLDEAAASFILCLPPLQRILLSRFPVSERSFQAVLSCYGESLRTLSLIASPDSDSSPSQDTAVRRIHQIQAHCPNLRELRLPILRTLGDASEVAIYNALGGLGQLTDILFQIHLAEAKRPEGERDDMGEHLPWAPSREIPISAAVDDTLVRKVFGRLFHAGARLLQRLKVRYCENSTPAKFRDIASIMTQQWDCTNLLEFSPHMDSAGFKLGVQKVGGRAKYLQKNKSIKLGACESVFRELWPVKPERWENDWHSFPLDSE